MSLNLLCLMLLPYIQNPKCKLDILVEAKESVFFLEFSETCLIVHNICFMEHAVELAWL